MITATASVGMPPEPAGAAGSATTTAALDESVGETVPPALPVSDGPAEGFLEAPGAGFRDGFLAGPAESPADRLAEAEAASPVDGVDGVGTLDGPLVGDFVGAPLGIGLGAGLGVDESVGVGVAVGAVAFRDTGRTPGATLVELPCQDQPTYPPSGTFSAPAPREA